MFVVRDAVREPLYAIVPYFNPWRWKSREKHTERALKHFHDAGCVIYLVEAAFNRRGLTFADSGLDGTPSECRVLGAPNADPRLRHRYIGLHTTSELWLKENLVNRAAQDLPFDWQQMCWLDADVHFLRPNWVGECIHKLQHYSFLQMFSQAEDVGPNYELLPENYPHSTGKSFARLWLDGQLWPEQSADAPTVFGAGPPPAVDRDLAKLESDLKTVIADVAQLKQDIDKPYVIGPGNVWPGLAWAVTRKAFEDVGGLFDVAIWGGGDYDMAHALVEQAGARIHHGVHEGYRRLLLEWEHRCRVHIRRNLGVMDGTIVHHWHGRKTERKYREKRQLMQKVNFDPLRFLKRDHQGLWQLHDDGSLQFVHFRDEFRRIAKERNEDSIDL